MRLYFAHPITIYDTEKERRCIALIKENGHSVENPNQRHHHLAYKLRGMKHFDEVVESCDGVAFLRFSDGMISAGVAREIQTALRMGLPVFEIVNDELVVRQSLVAGSVLSIDKTRLRIKAGFQ
jgi:hypothetical protein